MNQMNACFTLEKYNSKTSRHQCPECNRPKAFTRYIDTDTGEYIADYVGRCNRELSCGYHYAPRQFFESHPDFRIPAKRFSHLIAENKKDTPLTISTIKDEMFMESLGYRKAVRWRNHFICYLRSIFNENVVKSLIDRYNIGTAKYWDGAVVFWQMDMYGRIRTGKIMKYNPVTGKREKGYITWVHSIIGEKDFKLKQVLFGEHLLLNSDKPVLILEGEKKAIVASVIYPNYIVLSCGGLSQLSIEKMKILKGREVVLLPDVGCYDKWKIRAGELQKALGLNIRVSNYMEQMAKLFNLKPNDDIVDYFELLQQKLTTFYEQTNIL
jgi:hypothetical protein